MVQWGDAEDRRLCSGNYCTAAAPCLFDVVSDPGERHNLAPTEPTVVAAMQKRLAEIQKGFWSAPQMADNGQFCPTMRANGGFYGPWIPPGL